MEGKVLGFVVWLIIGPGLLETWSCKSEVQNCRGGARRGKARLGEAAGCTA